MNCLQQLIFSLSSDRLFKTYVSTSLSRRKLILVTTDFVITFPWKLYKFILFLKLGSLQVSPWNQRQFISYFFALIIYSINLLKIARKTSATGNAIYPLPRTIIQITNDNSIFVKKEYSSTKSILLTGNTTRAVLLKREYSSTKSILITGNTTRAVLVKLQCLHHPS